MVDDAVYHGRRHLVVPEDRAPPGELQVGREHDRLRLVGLGDHLEEQPGPVGVAAYGRADGRGVDMLLASG